LINQISQKNSTKNIKILEDSKKEKDKEDLNSNYGEKKKINDNYVEGLNPKDEIKNIKNITEKEINTKTLHINSEENKPKNNDCEKLMENYQKINIFNTSFFPKIKDIFDKDNLTNSYISSFFDSTTRYLKQELENEYSYYLYLNNSHNYIPKFYLEFNSKPINNNSNGYNYNINKNNKSFKDNNLNLATNQNIYFSVYNQININNNEKINEKNSNDEETKDNKNNILNNQDGIINNTKNENKMNIEEQDQIGGKLNLDEDNINNIQSFVPKNNFKNIYENQNSQTQMIFNNKSNETNNNINNNSVKRNENFILHNNASNNSVTNNLINFNQNAVDLQYKEFSNYTNKQIPFNVKINRNILNTNKNQKILVISKKNYESLKYGINNKLHNSNNQKISFQNVNEGLNDNITKNSNTMKNVGGYINLYNINYNNYINLTNSLNKIQNSIKDEHNKEQNEIKFPMNNLLNNNLNKNEYIVKMFGRHGWICRLCNNFNFESRIQCNRCKSKKMPKIKEEIFKEKDKQKKNKKKKIRKHDWLCLNCENINYGFRKTCNRCSMEKKLDFPSVYYDFDSKMQDKNSVLISMNNPGKKKNNVNNNRIKDNVNNLVNNNIIKNNNINYNSGINNNNSFNMNKCGNGDNLIGDSNVYNNN
jgi:hypothetical protein